MNSDEKIVSLDFLVSKRPVWRKQGRILVTTNGSFDLLHAGHVESLEESKAQGDILAVGINSDASVRAYKSSDRPVIGEKFRAKLVAALACVDFVFLFDEINPISFIEKLKPDVHTNGVDYGDDPVEKTAVTEGGGRLHILKKIPGLSTSEIVKKIIAVYGSDYGKN